MKKKRLTVLLGETIVGRVEQNKHGMLRFVYDDIWRDSTNAIPLSLSIPLVMREHEDEVVEAFLAGLLPDNREVLEAWGKRFHVSSRNPFALLSHIGEDCAGAVQFVREERLKSVMDEGVWEVEWLDENQIEERLCLLRQDRSAWRRGRDTGQFSLAGAQAKTALIHHEGRWGVPSGRAPTTHILKPPIPGLSGHVENEHFCLQLAGALALPVAKSRVERFGKEVSIVVERYDRVRTAELAAAAAAELEEAAAHPEPTTSVHPSAPQAAARAASLERLAERQPILRLHQEDLCQAMGRRPSDKYQNEGGPSPEQIAGLLQGNSSRPGEDVRSFVDALAFNWLVAGTDAHAKNYALLHGGGGRVRLAPLYDLASVLPYDELQPRRSKLAMKIGTEYRIHKISARHWRSLSQDMGLDPDEVVDRILQLIERMLDVVERVGRRMEDEGIGHETVTKLVAQIPKHAEECRTRLK